MLLQQSEIPSGFYSRILWSLPKSSSSISSEENLEIRNFERFFYFFSDKELEWKLFDIDIYEGKDWVSKGTFNLKFVAWCFHDISFFISGQ